MQQLKSKAIVLSRFNYRETDRILTVLTPNYGKIRLIAKGSRAMKSKLAGSIELFTINEIGFIKGKGDIATLIHGRMDINFPLIILDIKRVQLGYELLKIIDHTTEDETETEFFNLLAASLAGLNDKASSIELTRLWFLCRLIAVSGHMPNLMTDNQGVNLRPDKQYIFDSQSMSFTIRINGSYGSNHIKFLRLAFSCRQPGILNRVDGNGLLVNELTPMINAIYEAYL